MNIMRFCGMSSIAVHIVCEAIRHIPCTHSARIYTHAHYFGWMSSPHWMGEASFHRKTEYTKRKIWYICRAFVYCYTVNQLPFAIYKSLYHVYKLRFIRFNMWGVLVCMFVLLSLCVSGCVELQLKIEELVLYSCNTQCLYTAPAPHPHKHVMMMMMVEQTKHETKKKWRSHLLCELNTSISHYIYM